MPAYLNKEEARVDVCFGRWGKGPEGSPSYWDASDYDLSAQVSSQCDYAMRQVKEGVDLFEAEFGTKPTVASVNRWANHTPSEKIPLTNEWWPTDYRKVRNACEKTGDAGCAMVVIIHN